MAYVLLCALRRIGLHHTPFAKATCGTIRLKLLKIGALEPPRDFRRLQLLRKWSHDEAEEQQVFT
jgi:hypothetical protein